MNLVNISDVSHKFSELLYDNVNFSLQECESLAILGSSGSGKSTILNHLSTLLKPDSGIIDICEYKNIYNLNQKEILACRQKKLGIVFQAHYLFRGFSALDNIKVAEFISDSKADSKMLQDFKISHILKQHIGELSGGQQQRLSIARVLTKKPKVILADEPTGNLDKDTAKNVMSYLFEYIKEIKGVLVLATHDYELAELCTKSMIIENKRLRIIE